ncbi:MAG: hypothetical protein JW798_15115 [Prolixibacteraceae bacterium]|nr:hypothetical protein [Prolixibacteraceae bacterium]MBN2819754.1 hypothetical protein [Bacteroidales bacterium]
MKKLWSIIFLLFLLVGVACNKDDEPVEQEQVEQESDSENDFKVYSALLYSGKPDVSVYGISPIRLIYASSLWKAGESKEYPIEKNVRDVVKGLETNNNPVVIDIEHWDLTGSEEIVSANIKKMTDVIEWARDERENEKFGFYGELPQRDYWSALKGEGTGYENWVKGNFRLKELAEHVDAVFPSLYTFYNDPENWEKYAIANLREAKKYGKPVYAFLWPIYHDSNAELKGTHIDGQFWHKQLDVCKQYADGVVIWGGWKVEWDSNFAWWQETLKFMDSLKEH